jgi:hypothetical protein
MQSCDFVLKCRSQLLHDLLAGGAKDFLLSKTFIQTLGPTEHSIQCVKQNTHNLLLIDKVQFFYRLNSSDIQPTRTKPRLTQHLFMCTMNVKFRGDFSESFKKCL